MRSSRMARETEQVLQHALPPPKRVATHRSLRSFAHKAEKDGIKQEAAESDESALSSPPSSLDDGPRPSPGKRKRITAHIPKTNLSATENPTKPARRSPRKAPKLDPDGEAATTPDRKPRRQPGKRIAGPNGSIATTHPPQPPANWERVYDLTAAMRKRILAPVDTMGCESLAETHRSPQDQRLQTLVSLMLSSQTKDTVTAAAIRDLQTQLPGGLCVPSLLAVEPEELNRLIGKVGFHNNKTRFLKSVAVILQERYAGDIPDTIEGLISLPGVGPKMAYLCMSAAWGRDEGIGVDVHVHRITNLWGWHKTATPEQTRAELEAWLPREKWHGINHLLVGFGQTVCLPVGRRCGECDLSAAGLCPSAVVGAGGKRRVKKEVKLKSEGDGVKEAAETERVVVEADDVGVKLEAESEEVGRLEVLQATTGADGTES